MNANRSLVTGIVHDFEIANGLVGFRKKVGEIRIVHSNYFKYFSQQKRFLNLYLVMVLYRETDKGKQQQ